MRLNTSTPTLFAVSSLFCLGSSLPFFRRGSPWMGPLVRRETYSVVNVDSGSAATTVLETITETPAAQTQTIIETDSVTLESVTTDYIISTQTISVPETTQTLLITITPSPSPVTVTTTAYSIVNVGPASASGETPVPASTSTTSSASSTSASSSAFSANSSANSSTSISITPATVSSLSEILSGAGSSSDTPSQETSTSSSSASVATPQSVLSEPATYISGTTSSWETSTITSISTITTTAASSISTKSYGHRHTSYPPWSNGTATATLSVPPTQTPSTITTDAESD